MENNELVSVLMSTYNENKYELSLSIESILNQDYKNIEFIIIVDNPENEEALELLKYYKQEDSRINFIINQKNLGLSESLNKGLKICKGKYIARMDADDISLQNRITLQIEFLKNNENVDLVGTNITLIDEKGDDVKSSRKLIKDSILIKECLKYKDCLAHPSWMFKKEILEKFEIKEYRNISYCEDYDFLIRLVINGGNLDNMSEKLVKYRIRNNGICKSNVYKQIAMVNAIKQNYKKSLKFKNNNYLKNSSYLLKLDQQINEPKIYNSYLKILCRLENTNSKSKKMILRFIAILVQMMDKNLFINLIDRTRIKNILKNTL